MHLLIWLRFCKYQWQYYKLDIGAQSRIIYIYIPVHLCITISIHILTPILPRFLYPYFIYKHICVCIKIHILYTYFRASENG